MNPRLSLRARLTAIILVPLLLICIGVAVLAARDAQDRAPFALACVTALGLRDEVLKVGDDLVQRIPVTDPLPVIELGLGIEIQAHRRVIRQQSQHDRTPWSPALELEPRWCCSPRHSGARG